MGQQGGSRGPGNRDHEKEERNAHGAAAKIRDARPPPEEPGRDQRHANQENRLNDEFPERCGLAREDEGDRGHEPEAQHVQKGEGDQGPSRVPFEDRGDRHDGNRRRDSCHENPTIPNLGIRTQDREREDEAAQDHVAHPERDEEPSELLPRRDSGNRNLGQGERHPEDEGHLRNLFRVCGKAARGETDDEARSHHRGEAAPWAEHGGPRWTSAEKAAASEAREAAPTIAKTTATFCGIVIRSSIQSRRTRIATTGYAVVRGTTIAMGPRPMARKIVIPAIPNKRSEGSASRIPTRSHEPRSRSLGSAIAR